MTAASRDELLRRRGELIARSRQLRADWGQQAQGLRPTLAVADRARAGLQWLIDNPQWPIGAIVVLVVLRPRRVFRVAGLAWSGYGVYRRVRRVLNVPRSG